MERLFTAVGMARAKGIDPKRFRAALRKQRFSWHRHNEAWTVSENSPEHHQMVAVLRELLG
ncbi:MAG: hypothetical protein ABIH17_09225 [Pseudomonadota bacterium]